MPKLSVLNLIPGWFLLSCLLLFGNKLFAQAPAISYTPSTNNYATGTAITPLTPANSGGAVPATFGYGGAASLTAGTGGWNQPKGIAINASDQVYITNLGQFYIYKYDNSGNLLASIATSGIALTGIVATSTGDLYALQKVTGSIYKISGDVFSNTVITTISGATGNNNMAIDASNNLYITTSTGVSKYNIAGNTTTTPITAGAHINGPSGVAVDAAGNIYVLNFTGGTLEKFNSAGVWQSTLVSGLSSPYGLAMDGSGNFFIGQTGSSVISSYTSLGATYLPNISYAGYGLALDSRGVLYASNDNVTANRYAPNGGYYINNTLPTGLSFDNTTGIISGTPTVANASTAYKITGYNSSGSSSATVTISCATLAPSITYTPSTEVFQLNQVANYTPVNTGSPVQTNGYGISPALSNGLSFSTATGAITGTLTSTFAATNYTVTATNSTGSGTAHITLSCISTAPSLSYSPSSYSYPVNVAITALNPTNTGGVVSTWTITPNTLPTGLSFSTSTGAITGTPSALASATNYTVKGTNSQGNSSAVVSIAVVSNPPVIIYASPQSYLVGTTITTLNPTNTGGPVTATGWSVSPTLPAGLSLSNSTGAISGNPSVQSAATNYTVTAIGTAPSGNGTAVINITTYKQFTWLGGISTDWNTAGNWSGGIPGAGDQAVFNANYTNLPTISTSTSVGSLLIGTLGGKALTLTVNAPLTVNGDITYQSDNQSFNNFICTLAGSSTISAANLNIIANTVLTGHPYIQTVTASVSNLNLSGNIYLTSTEPASDTYDATFNFTGGTLTAGSINTTNAAGSTSTISISPTSTLNLTSSATFAGLSATGTNTLTVSSPTIAYTGNNNQTVYTGAAIANSSLTSGISYANISFSGTTGIKTALGSNLNVSGSFTNLLTSNTTNTYADLSAPTVNFNGAAQTLAGGGGTGTTFYNVTFGGSGTKTMSSGTFSVASTGILTMGAGTTLATGGFLTLKSDASGAAGVAVVPPATSITGNVNVQRFITGGTGKRGYRLLSSPVNAGGGNSAFYSINYIANSSYITGTTPSAGGIDQAGNPTLYLFRENLTPSQTSFTSGNFRGVGNMGTGGTTNITYSIDNDGTGFNIPVGNGFLFFFRGDRSVAPIATETVTSYVPTNTTSSAVGTLNTGSITVKDWFTPGSSNLSFTTVATPSPGNGAIRGYNLVGNPYPATINWEKYNRNSTVANSSIYGSNSLPSTIYQFNSTSKQYATYTQNSSLQDTTTTVYTGALNSSDGVVSNMIASGQGFFVLANAANQSLTFHESAKTSAQATSTNLAKVFAIAVPSTPTPDAAMRIKLVMDTINTDAVVLTLNSTNNAKYVYGEDAIDLGGDGALVNLTSLSADSVGLTVNKLPLPQTTALVSRLVVSASSSGRYSLKMDALENLPALYEVWLKDSFMKDSLDIRANTTYAFDIDNTNAATYGAGRFQVVIRQNPALGLHLLAFNAAKITTVPQVQVSWTVENEANYTTFFVQRSTDNGKTFQSIGSLQSDGAGTYSFIDTSPVTTGQDQYRLQMSDVNNTITYSSVITIQYSDLSNNNLGSNISLYPNPAHDLINISVTGTNASASSYTTTITNSIGAVIKTATSSQSAWQNNVSDLLPGTYFVQVVDNNKAVVGRSKFVKL